MDICQVCGEPVKPGDNLVECPGCQMLAGTGCCIAGRGVLCCACEEAAEEDDW